MFKEEERGHLNVGNYSCLSQSAQLLIFAVDLCNSAMEIELLLRRYVDYAYLHMENILLCWSLTQIFGFKQWRCFFLFSILH